MKTIGNVLWLVFGGLIASIILYIEGILCLITIVGIPIGLQLFKLAQFVMWPFGKKVVEIKTNSLNTVLNILWLIFGGIENAFCLAIIGLLLYITIIGIPFGLQFFKAARFVLTPLGYDFK